ncbi:MAG: hypothetical protein AB1695_09150 [Stygiobacter sp.]
MIDKLKNIFSFLNANRQFNHSLQDRFYKSVISPYNDKTEKVISLLYHIANTQSQPKIDSLASFYKNIFQDTSCMTSMRKFIDKVNPNQPLSFDSLYNGMKNQEGWGKKTAALFSKSIYHLHNGQYSENLKIWDDVPETISNNDNFYLPVDAVIIAIFNKLDNSKNWDFDKVNKTLKENYNGQEIEVWDDLWFWGFITQNGSGDNRAFEWNENKYWALKESDKNPDTIKTIKAKAQDFLNLLTNDN